MVALRNGHAGDDLAAIDSMMFRQLAPVGEPISLTAARIDAPQFPDYDVVWLSSGTAALALALLVVRQQSADVVDPEVILPAYGCPDVVSAALYAGLRPVLVDIGKHDPGIDFASLRRSLGKNSVALVGMNFLGIRERLDELRDQLTKFPAVALIQDDAQTFPSAGQELLSDYVCLSFGRGKPVSLLGGGALLIRRSLNALPLVRRFLQSGSNAGGSLGGKIRAFNVLTDPRFYGWVRRIPFLPLGVTRFRSLQSIKMMDSHRIDLIGANVRDYILRSCEGEALLRAALPADLSLADRLTGRAGRLLRYPVLCETTRERDRMLGALAQAGLGATAMYERPLNEIPGVAEHVRMNGPIEGARSFSSRLLTLPVHSQVTALDVARMAKIIQGLHSASG
jgi:dTDP-4-amino-4,6-dideoxygalactose transaminase